VIKVPKLVIWLYLQTTGIEQGTAENAHVPEVHLTDTETENMRETAVEMTEEKKNENEGKI